MPLAIAQILNFGMRGHRLRQDEESSTSRCAVGEALLDVLDVELGYVRVTPYAVFVRRKAYIITSAPWCTLKHVVNAQ
jgi:hypothetical protein